MPTVTAGAAALVVAGSGPATSTPGDTAMATGLFGFSYTDDANGCGRIVDTVYPPTGGGPYEAINTLDCPTWVNPLDGSWPDSGTRARARRRGLRGHGQRHALLGGGR